MSRNLTTTEQKIWVGQKVAGNIPLYNMAMSYRIKGALDASQFTKCFNQLIEEHDILRSIVIEQDNKPKWRIRNEVPRTLQVIHVEKDQKEHDIQFSLEKLAATPIDMTQHVYFSHLLKVSDNDWIWLFNIHHIATDATSFKLLYERMQQIYSQYEFPEQISRRTTIADLPQPFQLHQNSNQADATNADDNSTNITTDDLRLFQDQTAQNGYRSVTVSLQQESELEQAEKLFGTNPLTKNLQLTCMHIAILGCILHRLSGENSISIAVPIHNRTTRQRKISVGLIMDVTTIQLQIKSENTLLELVNNITTQLINAYSNEQNSTHISKSRTSKAVVNFLAVTYNNFLDMPTTVDWIDSGYIDKEHLARLQVIYFNKQALPQIKMDINCDALSKQRRLDFINIYHDHARKLILHPEKAIRLISFDNACLPAKTIVKPHEKFTLWDNFEIIVSKYKDSIALDCQGETITYEMLYRKSCLFSLVLNENSIKPGQLVGIDTSRRLETVIAILGIIRLGGKFVPIDNTLPSKRRQQIIDQIERENKEPLKIISPITGKSENFSVDPWQQLDQYIIDNVTAPNLPRPPRNSDSCYVLFTSGTTGQPKGVEITHGSLSNYLSSVNNNVIKNRRLTFALFSALHFDLTLTSLFLPLITGGTLIIYPQHEIKGPDTSVLRAIQDPRIDVLKATPSHLEICDDLSLDTTNITEWIIGGEAFKTSQARRLNDLTKNSVNIYNEYGPTEATIGCMLHRFCAEEDTALDVPIGNAIPNTHIYLLDQYFQPLPPMVQGQLFISGENLAKGYLGDHELTAKKFIPSPFRQGDRMYATGDKAFIDDSKIIHYVGRIDLQIKLQGVRVETGEIEAEISQIPGINNVAVSKIILAGKRTQDPAIRCKRCGIPAQVPGIRLNEHEICNTCLDYDIYKDNVDSFFGTENEFDSIVRNILSSSHQNANCIALFSGGKDSSYMLYQLVDKGLTPLVFTLDNGFISEQAKQNISRVITDLKLEHVFASTPGMNRIFAESLKRFSDVCNGCFKTIYTLSTKLALDRGINTIFTGLSSGQLVDTRLGEYYKRADFKKSHIDNLIIEARKLYHRMDDEVSRCIDTTVFEDDETFRKVSFVDFYRYHDVPLSKLYHYLDNNAPWVRPSDTGRSTNCQVNDVGIYIHKKELGHHNYAKPYSWDVRLGHKNRESALVELDDQIDVQDVTKMLNEIGYSSDTVDNSGQNKELLVAFYCAENEINEDSLRTLLSDHLPTGLIPSRFIPVNTIPITNSGKRDHRALQQLALKHVTSDNHTQATSPIEKVLYECWKQAFGFSDFGVDSSFFHIGGDSLTAISIASIAETQGILIAPHMLITHPTIASLADEVSRTNNKNKYHAENGSSRVENTQDSIQSDLNTEELDDLFSYNNLD